MMQPDRSGEAIYRVLSALPDDPKRSGNGYSARCPAHEDRVASLSIRQGDQGAVLFCHAGCTPEAVTEALGLTMAELFDKPRNGVVLPLARSWRILDSGGHEVAVHKRIDEPEGKKKFWWERNGKTGLGGLPKADLPLYRVPELLAAPEGSTVYVCEGEKATDALTERGQLAVGTVTGAPSLPSDASLTPLLRYDVVLWPDNDSNGLKQMQGVAERLRALGKSPRWLIWKDAPEKGDAFDYFAGGGAVDQLAGMVCTEQSEPERQRVALPKGWTAGELQRHVFEPPRWAIPDLLAEGATILAGRPKLGKSWLGLHLCIEVARGGLALGRIRVQKGEALYMALEDGDRRVQERLHLMLGDDPWPDGLHIFTEWPKVDADGATALDAWLEEHPACRLVVVDTFKRIRARQNAKARLYDDDYEALQPMGEIGRRRHAAIVPVMHARKGEADDPLDMVSGTTGTTGSVDAAMVLRRERGQADASLFVTGRDIEERDLALKWSKDDFTWSWLGDAEEFRQSKERQELLAAVSAMPGMKPAEIADGIGKTRGSVRYLLFKLVREGKLRVKLDGTYHPGIDNPTQWDHKTGQLYPTANTANSPYSAIPLTDSSTPVSTDSAVSTNSPVSAVSGAAQKPRKCLECGWETENTHQVRCATCIERHKNPIKPEDWPL